MNKYELIPEDEWDKLWLSWKHNHLAELQDSKVSDDFIKRDMRRLFKLLDEYTPTTPTKCGSKSRI